MASPCVHASADKAGTRWNPLVPHRPYLSSTGVSFEVMHLAEVVLAGSGDSNFRKETLFLLLSLLPAKTARFAIALAALY